MSRSDWRKRILVAAIALLVVVLATIAAFALSHRSESPFRTAPVARADISERVTATGSLQPVITSPVGAQVSGIVWKLHADFNSRVKAGQVLVELDSALFHNAVALATAELSQAQANLKSAQATALGARIARDRASKLRRESVGTEADLDAAEATYGQATGAVRSASAQIAQARAELDRAKLDLDHSIIRSPVDGTVISRNVDVGQAVASTLQAPTLFTIAQDLRRMQVHAAVDEADIGGIHVGQRATFSVDAFRDRTFDAVVHEVRNAPQTAQNVVTYDAVLDVDNSVGLLRPGMTANVSILVTQKNQVVAVPNEALRFRPAAAGTRSAAPAGGGQAGAGAAVYVPAGSRAVRVSVVTGITDGTLTEVSGLEPGREVIVDVARGKKPAPTNAPAGGGVGRGF